MWLVRAPLWSVLQEAEAAVAECRNCTPFGRLSVQQIFQSGSTAEGFSDIEVGKSSVSDHDAMYELGPLRWLTPWSEVDQCVSEGSSKVDTASRRPPRTVCRPAPLAQVVPCESPGFVTLWVVPETGCDHKTPRQLSAASVRRLMFNMQRVCHNPKYSATITGPSVALQGPKIMYGGVDHVSCIHLPVWPAAEFRRRSRTNNFPPAPARDDICRFGVHLVPTGHKGSPVELADTQLRLSFSRAELVAAWHLNHYQRVTLKTVKAMKNAMKAAGNVALKSYFIKMAVFWLCQDASAKCWSNIVEAVRMIFDWLEAAVIKHQLPCFFWDEINLLSGVSEADLEATRRTIEQLRDNMTRSLLACCWGKFSKEVLFEGPEEPLSERELRLRLARGQIVNDAKIIVQRRPTAPAWRYWSARQVPALLRQSAAGQLEYTHHCELGSSMQQMSLLHAFLVAPVDLVRDIRLTPSSEGLFTWDAAPLFGLLTDSDMDLLLGDYRAVRDWWQRQLLRPSAERPAGLGTSLDSPRGRAELLLNAELFARAYSECIPNWKRARTLLDNMSTTISKVNNPVLPGKEQCEKWLRAFCRSDLEEKLRRIPNIDGEEVVSLARRWREELERRLSDTRLSADYDVIRSLVPDRWRLKQYVFTDGAQGI